MKTILNSIDGQLTPSTSKKFLDVHNPSTAKIIAKVGLSSVDDVHLAINVAKKAQVAWGKTAIGKRCELMFEYKLLLEKNKEEIAQLISLEHGKTFEDALGEVARGIESVSFACSASQMLKGDYSQMVASNIDCFSLRQPLGVCAGITPFNFPCMVPLWMYPIAIVCGNAFVLKPSEKDPSTALLLADLFYQAGFPKGIFNVVQGDKTAVDTLLTHSDIKSVSFVGSTPIAQYIYQTGTAHKKRVQALAGAKNHMVVMSDAEIEDAANALLGAAYGSAGERCMAISVAVAVGQKTHDALIDSLKPKVQGLRIGPGVERKNYDLGPVISAEHLQKIKSYVDVGVEEGADLVVDGRDFQLKGYEDGYFIGGCLFANVQPNMRIAQEEIFGPVLCVICANDYEHAKQIIHQNPYGNGTSIFTKNGAVARNFSHDIEVGMVGINVPIPVPVGYHSFGGWKDSNFGSHGIYGPEGFHFYTRLKTVTQRWSEKMHGAKFHFATAHKDN